MARKTKQSNVMDQRLAAHAKDETTFAGDFTELPSGIRDGVAILKEAKLGEYSTGKNQGKQFIHLRGVILEPVSVTSVVRTFSNGRVEASKPEVVKIAGQQTSLTLPLADMELASGDIQDGGENVAKALNELRKLGGEECTATINSPKSLEAVLNALKNSDIHFKFSTSSRPPTQQYPTERVFHNWHGSLEDYEPEESSAVIDESGEEEEVPEPDQEGSVEDIVELVAAATENEEGPEADRLTELAIQFGKTEDEVIAMAAWSDVGDFICSKMAGENSTDAEDNPAEGETYLFKAPRMKSPIECEVTEVNNEAETVTLKNLKNGKVYSNIPWSKLE
jgi:hypothetical protein